MLNKFKIYLKSVKVILLFKLKKKIFFYGKLSNPSLTALKMFFANSTKSNIIEANIIKANKDKPNNIDSSTNGDPLLLE